MQILALNGGSSSLKYKLLEMPAETVLASGRVERIGEGERASAVHVMAGLSPGPVPVKCPSHRQAIQVVHEALTAGMPRLSIGAVGHRVVHGRDLFTGPVRIDDQVLRILEGLFELAPLHNPLAVAIIRACREFFPGLPQVALFDTGFHQTMPPHAYLYPVPLEWHRDFAVRRYGFHGISYQFVNAAAAAMLAKPLGSLKLVTTHLGNGASITAFDHGRVLDTSMGFTPLEGLMMGSRSGYFDPAIIPYMMRKTGMSVDSILNALNTASGLAGISGIGRDMRTILKAREEGDQRAELAFSMFTYTLKKYLGAYLFALGGADAIVFTGGIGENIPEIRAAALEGLDNFGILLDRQANLEIAGGRSGAVGAGASQVEILVIPTDEERMIARETFCLLTEEGAGNALACERERNMV